MTNLLNLMPVENPTVKMVKNWGEILIQQVFQYKGIDIVISFYTQVTKGLYLLLTFGRF